MTTRLRSSRSLPSLGLILSAGLLAGCLGGPQPSRVSPTSPSSGQARGRVAADAAARGSRGDAAAAAVAAALSQNRLPVPTEFLAQELDIGVLLPSAKPDDSEVMNIAGVSIFKSHIYDRLFQRDAKLTKDFVDDLVFDILLAQEAKKHSIIVDASIVDEWVDGVISERKIREQGNFEEFIQTTHGIDSKSFKSLLRLGQARRLLRYYVVRYLGMLDDRVQVRLIQHHDRKVIEGIRAKAVEGAEFNSLALRQSEHPTRSNGGLLAPISRDSEVIWRDQAFALEESDVSKIIPVDVGGVRLFNLLYCVRHLRGRKVSFADAKADLDLDWSQHKNLPTREERRELYLRLRSASEALNNGGEKR